MWIAKNNLIVIEDAAEAHELYGKKEKLDLSEICLVLVFMQIKL